MVTGRPGGTRQVALYAAIALLEAGGPEAVQARRVADEIGTSTMALYTYFDGMGGLFDAMAREGLARITDFVRAVPKTDDAVADFFVQGLAVRQWGLDNPELYRLMFGMSGSAGSARSRRRGLAVTLAMTPEGRAAFGVMTKTLERAKATGQIADVDTNLAAGQFLSATHGFVLLEMAGYFEYTPNAVALVLAPMGASLMIGMGASAESVEQAGRATLARLGIG
jgi:AcrR family transcriptional regulator